jgi:CBS-domain-containing membrane protein
METQSSQITKCLKIYIGENDMWHGNPLFMALLEKLLDAGLAGATVTRGIAGFGARSRIHTSAIIRLSEDLPVIIEVIDYAEKIDAILDTVYPMVREGLITLEDVKIVKYTHRGLNPLPGYRLVKEVMSSPAISITPQESVAQAWSKMVKFQLKALPVVNEDQQVVGIITDEDLIARAGLQQRLSIARQLDPDTIEEEIRQLSESHQLVEDIMTRPVIITSEETALSHAVGLMKKHHLKRIPITGKGGKLVGMLSRLDVLRQIASIESTLPIATPFLTIPKLVGDIMSPEIPLVAEEDQIEKIIETLLRYQSHRSIVVDDQNRVSGIISDVDIVNRIPGQTKSSILSAFKQPGESLISNVTARQIMSKDPIQAQADLPIPEAIQMMISEGRKIMVIVDDEKHPLGLVDRQSLLEALINVPHDLD